MNELPLRTVAEMVELFDEMNAHLESSTPEGTRYILSVVGGVAMGAVFADRATQDVDVVTQTIPTAVREAVRAVAKAHQMPEQWLNNDVADMVDVDLPFDAFAPVYINRNLEVLAAKPEYLLALKLMAGRGKDLKDLVRLAEHVGATSSSELLAVWERVYATNPAYSTERGFVESVCVDIARLLLSHLSGNDTTADIERLATSYEGEDLHDDDPSLSNPRSDEGPCL